MKKLNQILITVWCVILYASCGGGHQHHEHGGHDHHHQEQSQVSLDKDVDKLKDEVMAIHDEVMPEIGALRALTEKLEAKQTTLENDNKKRQVVELEELKQQIADLKKADKAMFDWMKDYGKNVKPNLEGDKAKAIELLEAEMPKIEKVKAMMESSMAAAKKTLGEE